MALGFSGPSCITCQRPVMTSFGPRHEKTCLCGFANNKGADQLAHPCSLISAFVIHLLESVISKFGVISIFYPVSVTEETALSLLCWKPEDQFCCVEAHIL